MLPLEDDTLKLYQGSVPAPRATYMFYPGMTRLDRLSAPDIYSYNSRFRASVSLVHARANGIILAAGDSSCGYEWYLQDGYLHFGYVYTRNAIYAGKSRRRVPVGEHELGLRITKTGESEATVTLELDGKAIGAIELPHMWPIYAANAGIRCGENRHAPVTRAYEPPYVFDQTLTRVVVDVDIA